MMSLDLPRGEFQPADFWMVFEHLPEGCALLGGQAVAWWALRYGISANDRPITSEDIDFWGGREDLKHVARCLKLKPIFPGEYEMTVWSGAIQLEITGKSSLADFLHTIPGLEILDPEKAAAIQQYNSGGVNRVIRVLTPISLIMSKLHCLRHFPQEGRNDELHLRICLKTARHFLTQALEQGELRQLLWNIERLVSAHHLKPYRRLETSLGFNLLDAIPIEEMKAARESNAMPEEQKQRLGRFLNQRWPQVLHESETTETDTA